MNDVTVKMTDYVQISVEATDKNGRLHQHVRYIESYRFDGEMDYIVKEMTKEMKEEIENKN